MTMTKSKLEKEIERLQTEIKKLKSEALLYAKNQEYLKKLAEKAGSEKSAIYREKLKLEEECTKLASKVASLNMVIKNGKSKTK